MTPEERQRIVVDDVYDAETMEPRGKWYAFHYQEDGRYRAHLAKSKREVEAKVDGARHG